MTIALRSGRPDDVAPAAALFVESLQDLARRNGLTPPPYTPEGMEPVYRHLLETGIVEVAYDADELVAFAMGFVRDGLFFLSMFWAKPGRQKQGVGGPLLDRVWQAARARGATTFSVWSSIDYAALGSYLKRGMRPVGPVLTFGGPPAAVEHAATELVPLDAAAVMSIDRGVRGTARPEDHAFFRTTKHTALLVRAAGRDAGYFYAHEGRIGPAAWHEGQGRMVLGAALQLASSQAPSVTMAVLGPSTEAIDVALAAKLKIVGTSHFLTSAPFGALARYVPSGPALF